MSADEFSEVIKWVSGVGAGTVVGATATIVISLIKRSTLLGSKNIDDAARFRAERAEQFESLWNKVDAMDRMVSGLRMRDAIFIRCFSAIGGEIRLLNGFLGIHMVELNKELLDKAELQAHCQTMTDALTRMTSLIDAAESDMLQIATQHVADLKNLKQISKIGETANDGSSTSHT